MVYYRNRYYSPQTGRFISEDPIGWASGQTNAYAYVGGNPVQFRDPSGLQMAFPIPVGPTPGGGPIHNNNRPGTGDPDSTFWPGLRPDGSPGEGTYGDGRKYGPDGRPEIDYDHSHPGRHDGIGDHVHDWIDGVWSKFPRPYSPLPKPPKPQPPKDGWCPSELE
ncbi:RHS repeat-associated core domain-containing protein [Paraburkholderia sp. USG1]|uniref:RHS repeat-associated core domain-containing protein n=1 Tax=Paraburkholderia sp. USG1 TaxID=2952268 RepID=UPI002855A042|nr:RHS repeat-associated core domain-containing protein [Paraburkholderia sp. USG1]MDR8397220.1 RHS repeat-associated core domain-containing protein [Paraburkholderia sp. USG1]